MHVLYKHSFCFTLSTYLLLVKIALKYVALFELFNCISMEGKVARWPKIRVVPEFINATPYSGNREIKVKQIIKRFNTGHGK